MEEKGIVAWVKTNKWYIIVGLIALVVIFGGDIGVPTFNEGQK